MMCKIYKILFRWVPIKRWQSFIISRHFETCPACRVEILEEQRLEQLLVTPGQVVEEDSLWWEIRAGIVPSAPVRRRRLSGVFSFQHPRLAWGMAAAVLVIAAVLLTVPSIIPDNRANNHRENKIFSVRSAEREGKPVQFHVFSSKDPDMTMVWVEKN